MTVMALGWSMPIAEARCTSDRHVLRGSSRYSGVACNATSSEMKPIMLRWHTMALPAGTRLDTTTSRVRIWFGNLPVYFRFSSAMLPTYGPWNWLELSRSNFVVLLTISVSASNANSAPCRVCALSTSLRALLMSVRMSTDAPDQPADTVRVLTLALVRMVLTKASSHALISVFFTCINWRVTWSVICRRRISSDTMMASARSSTNATSGLPTEVEPTGTSPNSARISVESSAYSGVDSLYRTLPDWFMPPLRSTASARNP